MSLCWQEKMKSLLSDSLILSAPLTPLPSLQLFFNLFLCFALLQCLPKSSDPGCFRPSDAVQGNLSRATSCRIHESTKVMPSSTQQEETLKVKQTRMLSISHSKNKKQKNKPRLLRPEQQAAPETGRAADRTVGPRPARLLCNRKPRN